MRRPNILLLYTDQQRWDTLGCVNPLVETPNLDHLADRGVLFEQAYCNNPVCMPSRQSMLSGRYPSTVGTTTNGIEMPEDLPHLATMLGPRGYHTAQLGKLHFLNHSNRDHRDLHPRYGFDTIVISDEPGCYEDAYIKWVTVDHWKIGQWYLGRFYMPPPWHFAFVMTLAVVPLALTILYLVGIARAGWDKARRALVCLLLISALAPMLALAIGQTVVYDNDRLFMPAFPFLAALAGLGVDWLARGLTKVLRRVVRPQIARPLALVAVALLFIPHLVLAGGLYPHLLSYYTEAIGGLPGAVRLGLETTYWCETYAQALDHLNDHASPGAVVWVQDWSHDVMFTYQLHGQLRDDLRITWPEDGSSVFGPRRAEGVPIPMDEADYVVLQYRETGFTDEIRRYLRGRTPAHRLTRQRTLLLGIYEN